MLLVTRCESHVTYCLLQNCSSIHVVKISCFLLKSHLLLVAKISLYSLLNWLVVKYHSSLIAKFTLYLNLLQHSLQSIWSTWNEILNEIKEDDILKINWSLFFFKAHEQMNTWSSIRIKKLCDSAIVRRASISYRNYLNDSSYPGTCKKWDTCVIHKKNDEQVINNCRPVSLLPI